MSRVVQRLRSFLRRLDLRSRVLLWGIGPRPALTGAIVLLALALLALSLSVVWFGITSSRQRAIELAQKEKVTPPPVQPDFPLVFGPGPSPRLEELTSPNRSFAERRRFRGIPGLSEMQVMAYLRDTPGTDFRCPGGASGKKRVCTSSVTDDPATYEVTFLDEAGSTVAVVATAYDAPADKAAEVLGRVAELSLKNAVPMNARSWVGRNISSGGQYLAEGVDVRLYGTERARTLEIVSTSSRPAQEPAREATSPKAEREASKNGAQGKTTAEPK